MKIKETLELLDGVEVIGVFGARVLKDGKITIGDIKELSFLYNNLNKLLVAMKGIGNVDDELKELDIEEIKILLERLYALGKNVGNALK